MSNLNITQNTLKFRKNTPNLIGQKFGKLLVVDFAGKINKRLHWNCICDCGNTAIRRTDNLFHSTNPPNCGCTKIEILKSRSHGRAKTPEHKIWIGMRARCNPNKQESHPNYAGRGIRVCERWQKFENFFEDMGERPSPKHTLERINNDGNYCPENCRWATYTEQLRNKRDNLVIDYQGISSCLSEHCERLGVNYDTVYNRLRSGWTPDESFSF